MMFTDSRSKKIVLVAHCILNQNSISDGTADLPGTFQDVVILLLDSDVGIIQMPCLELLCLGLDRGNSQGEEKDVVVENTRIRKALKEGSSVKKIDSLVDQLVFQVEEYIKHDFMVKGIIGVNRSPSCGVETTSMNKEEVPGKGVFIKKFEEKLSEKEIDIKIIGVKTSEIDKSIDKVKQLLNSD